jgi:prophage regulatory protein
MEAAQISNSQERNMPSQAKSSDQPYSLPETGFVRQKQLATIIPFSRTTLWRKVKDGEFPAPVHLSAGVTAWRVETIRVWIESRV